ncbi:MAG: PEPxxWA-CTERM sorting domain-containing protein [Sphingomonadaceae bacterium]|uniref:PEPxxWA-CTERM sorting domain-containing protein n=1 Tax=Thermaurantiacus sp. TaxID=2820283 RepID=UPI00298F0AD1|nr:PEPxxWA-CTERM sorting domain-containing protein [Thermaurantiacus sp.]MCS6987102.1 PEPxxWA-CTERM sorting domain-containing protein [Sphingomonadaceae bacterium]MDW8415560.1 PEPxxWA-CTERM sorting domain-containing protein [Thermaurantiacus sp.]
MRGALALGKVAVIGAMVASAPSAAAVEFPFYASANYDFWDAWGYPLADGADSTFNPGVWAEVFYTGDVDGYDAADFGEGRGQAGDRYARAFSAAGLLTGDHELNGLGLGRWMGTAVSEGTGTADMGVLLRGLLNFVDPLPLLERKIFTCTGTVDCRFYGKTNFDFFLGSQASLRLEIEEVGTGTRSLLSATFAIYREILRVPNADGGFDQSFTDRAAAYWIGWRLTPGGNELLGSDLDELTITQSGAYHGVAPTLNPAIPVHFVSGRSYQFMFELACGSTAAGLAAYMTSGTAVSTECNAVSSAYLMGLANFRDAAGNPIAPFALRAPDGTNLALPSPFAPGGGGPAPIPEPATWALHVSGFGVVGLAARRRRSPAAV